MTREEIIQMQKIAALEQRIELLGAEFDRILQNMVRDMRQAIVDLKAPIVTLEETRCPECGEYSPDDDRVEAGMKCWRCAAYDKEREQETAAEKAQAEIQREFLETGRLPG